MIINYKDKEITLKNSFRAMMMFENINGATFTGGTLTEAITFFYCVVVTSSKDYTINYDDVVDWLDENPEKLKEFGEWVVETSQNNNKLKKD